MRHYFVHTSSYLESQSLHIHWIFFEVHVTCEGRFYPSTRKKDRLVKSLTVMRLRKATSNTKTSGQLDTGCDGIHWVGLYQLLLLYSVNSGHLFASSQKHADKICQCYLLTIF